MNPETRALIDEAATHHAINLIITGKEGLRVLLHAGHLISPAPGHIERLGIASQTAQKGQELVRKWLAVVEPLRPFHEVRLHAGSREPDGFDPDRLTFEWPQPSSAPPLETIEPQLFDSWTPSWAVEAYPLEDLRPLKAQTHALVAYAQQDHDGLRVKLRITTRLLAPPRASSSAV